MGIKFWFSVVEYDNIWEFVVEIVAEKSFVNINFIKIVGNNFIDRFGNVNFGLLDVINLGNKILVVNFILKVVVEFIRL